MRTYENQNYCKDHDSRPETPLLIRVLALSLENNDSASLFFIKPNFYGVSIMLKLSPLVDIIPVNNTAYFVTDDISYLEDCDASLMKALRKLKTRCQHSELVKILGKKRTKQLLSELQTMNFLRTTSEDIFDDSLAQRQVYYFDAISKSPTTTQKKLSEKCVCILGMGGVGSVVFQHLIGAGLKNFIVIDNDCVEISNFNRQFTYSKKDIGRPKVECAKEYAGNIDQNITVHSCQTFIKTVQDLNILQSPSIDFFVCAADMPVQKIQYIVNDYCVSNRIPFAYAGVGIQSGSWGPFIVPEETCCYRCFCNMEEKEAHPVELLLQKKIKSIVKASFGPFNTVVSTFLVKDIILFLAGCNEHVTLGRRWHFDFRTMQIAPFTVNAGQYSCNCVGKLKHRNG